jgi:hypothetical protein
VVSEFVVNAPAILAILVACVWLNRHREQRFQRHALRWLPVLAFAMALVFPNLISGIYLPSGVPQAAPAKIEADTAPREPLELIDIPEFWREENLGGQVSLLVNRTPAVFGLELLTKLDPAGSWSTQLYPSYAAALAAVPMRPGVKILPSFAMLNQKAKTFGDALLAALELELSSNELAPGGGKDAFIAALLQAVLRTDDDSSAATEVSAFLAAAAELGGAQRQKLRPAADAKRTGLLAEFASSRRSRPIGFYGTGDPELAAVFQRDRFLQQPLSDAASVWLARIMMPLPELRSVYGQWLDLATCITNPPARLTLADLFDLNIPDSGLDDAIYGRLWRLAKAAGCQSDGSAGHQSAQR